MTQFVGTLSFSPPQFSGAVRVSQPHLFTDAFEGRGYFGGTIEARIPQQVGGSLFAKSVFKGHIAVSKGLPYGAFRDFAHYGDAVADPAMVLIRSESGGQPTFDAAAPSQMRRVWATVLPPREYPTTTEPYAWPRAAFASVGIRVNQLMPTHYQYIDGAQVEVTPTPTTGPTAYAPARALKVKVLPDRLNYSPNPRFANDLSGWAFGGTPDAPIRMWPGGAVLLKYPSGSNASDPLLSLVERLRNPPGSTWSASMEVECMSASPGPVTLRGQVRGYTAASGGSVTFSDYGPTTVINPGETKTIVCGSGRSTTSNTQFIQVELQPFINTAPGTDLQVGRTLIERTGVPGEFFDGDGGIDYVWEEGGTPGSTRSYYYRDRQARSYLLERLLEENCPLGVIPAVPQFAVLPSE